MIATKDKKMQVIKNEYITLWDVDDTLVMHTKTNNIPIADLVLVDDPVNVNSKITMQINKSMIRLMQEEYSRGAQIIVWSRGGHAWAESVVKALKISDIVHLIMSKPLSYFDDKDVSEWLKYRVYLPPGTVYKDINK